MTSILTKQGFNKISNYAENISIYRIIQLINLNKSDLSVSVDAEVAAVKASEIVAGNSIIRIIKDIINSLLKVTKSGSSIVAVYHKPYGIIYKTIIK